MQSNKNKKQTAKIKTIFVVNYTIKTDIQELQNRQVTKYKIQHLQQILSRI